MHTENQSVQLPLLIEKQVSLSIKREDLIHPLFSGNKYRKLKYNLEAAKSQGFDTLLTFGGAFSNHIAATAYAGKLQGLKTVGVIRGEEISAKWETNPTLKLASEHGMQFKFISRDAYRDKNSEAFINILKSEFGAFYLLPEGGSNVLAVKGCEEILTPEDAQFDMICSSVGTGGTLAGIINASLPKQGVLGFPALKGDFLIEDIRNFTSKENWQLQSDYHFGGYAKVSAELIHFINDFKERTQIPLDPIYTGKLLYGILELVKKDHFEPKTKILAIHTGGLQSISGMNAKLKKKNLPQIKL
ncbi:1-aminocyclopropane-1-carboxylate deaminase/D-cysteine desulfhydrase [Maribacter algarum]|uniref:1-aminocyclopropane-1-carboxylate deaminase/D-cysteine desulfhydrase n=1 Tax=Maribacter algarum (ex Zhang et al. 2020) TaxID=2578118 RepID=A0A5S3PJB1_9FLAO|nr:pyridoxal-phosphate dependent enzyme [Maribacter algarum]TMM52194.1 1-aminocyclopropane-1-carboxylate deaminase/D-cysteine desulfhydrase [Maribacter algarum]